MALLEEPWAELDESGGDIDQLGEFGRALEVAGVATEGQTDEDAVDDPAKDLLHDGMDVDFVPLLRVGAPGALEGVLDLLNDIVGHRVEFLGDLSLDLVGNAGPLLLVRHARMEHGVLGTQELLVGLELAEDAVRLL